MIVLILYLIIVGFIPAGILLSLLLYIATVSTLASVEWRVDYVMSSSALKVRLLICKCFCVSSKAFESFVLYQCTLQNLFLLVRLLTTDNTGMPVVLSPEINIFVDAYGKLGQVGERERCVVTWLNVASLVFC